MLWNVTLLNAEGKFVMRRALANSDSILNNCVLCQILRYIYMPINSRPVFKN